MFDHAPQLFFGIGFPLFAIYAAYAIQKGWRLGKASEQWPATEGTIIESREDYDGESYRPRIRYQYKVHSDVFEADTITYRGLNLHRSNVEAYLKKYPEGANALVYYDPVEPEKSVLEPGADKSSYFMAAVVIAVLFTIGISLLIYELWHFFA